MDQRRQRAAMISVLGRFYIEHLAFSTEWGVGKAKGVGNAIN